MPYNIINLFFSWSVQLNRLAFRPPNSSLFFAEEFIGVVCIYVVENISPLLAPLFEPCHSVISLPLYRMFNLSLDPKLHIHPRNGIFPVYVRRLKIPAVSELVDLRYPAVF